MRTRNGGSVMCVAGGLIFTAGLALACTDTTGTAPTYTVGGTVSGLAGSGLVLRNNGGDDLAVSANGPAVFATALSSGAAYSVTVFAQPSGPDQSCVVIGGSGQVSTANVTNIGVTCTAVPTSELAYATVSAAVLAPSHTCGVTTSRVAYCWGNNETGELGDGMTATSPTPVSVAGGLTFAAVSAGNLYTCGVTSAGALYCWGNVGLLFGPGGGTPFPTSPVPFAPGLTFATVSAGAWHVCGVTTAGAAYCWGDSFYGQRGIGRHPTGSVVVGGLTFASVTAGWSSTCGVTTAGAAYCWGDNTYGELGIGPTTGPEQCYHKIGPSGPWYSPCSDVPVAVAGGFTFEQVAVGGGHACGVTPSGTAYCWGFNGVGQLGNGTTSGPDMCFNSTPCTPRPVVVAGGLTFAVLSAGAGDTCGLSSTGAAYCWGWNGDGQLGDGTTINSAIPVAVAGGLTFAMISVGEDTTCGVTQTGVAYCWGANGQGNLGNGTTTNSTVPVKVAGQP